MMNFTAIHQRFFWDISVWRELLTKIVQICEKAFSNQSRQRQAFFLNYLCCLPVTYFLSDILKHNSWCFYWCLSTPKSCNALRCGSRCFSLNVSITSFPHWDQRHGTRSKIDKTELIERQVFILKWVLFTVRFSLKGLDLGERFNDFHQSAALAVVEDLNGLIFSIETISFLFFFFFFFLLLYKSEGLYTLFHSSAISFNL